MIGETLAHFQIKASLGEGGVGEAWLAYDPSLEQDVAIEILPDSVSEDPERLSRFEREAMALAVLNHPNIAAVYGLYDAGKTSFVAYEHVDGESLSDRLAGPQPFSSAGELLDFARQLSEAIEAAHDQGVVHRDLKPANIKIRKDGVVKVLDFGLARMVAEESGASAAPEAITAVGGYTDPEMIMKTAPYLSPEQARGERASRRSDVWALGCILYEALAGKRAFTGGEATEILGEIVEKTPDFGSVPGSVPDYFVTLVKRCLDKDQRMRLRDAGEIRIAIERGGDDDAAAPAAGPSSKALIPWLIAGVLALAVIILLLRGS